MFKTENDRKLSNSERRLKFHASHHEGFLVVPLDLKKISNPVSNMSAKKIYKKEDFTTAFGEDTLTAQRSLCDTFSKILAMFSLLTAKTDAIDSVW